ncbi:hypothetical protein VPH35_133041 [Triticum aestivum]
MTKIISDKLPSSTSAETTKGKGPPSPAAGSAAHLDDDDDKVFQVPRDGHSLHVRFLRPVRLVIVVRSRALVQFLYSMVMIHLWLIKRRDQKTCEPEACELTTSIRTPGAPELMMLATGIMLISLGVAIFVFRPDSYDLALVAFTVFLSMGGMFIFLKCAEVERKRLEELSAASDLVPKHWHIKCSGQVCFI